jgi:hypothetical protein
VQRYSWLSRAPEDKALGNELRCILEYVLNVLQVKTLQSTVFLELLCNKYIVPNAGNKFVFIFL